MEEWKQYMWENIIQSRIHEHSITCRKPPSGYHGCRMVYGAGFNAKTQCRELKAQWDKREQGTPLLELVPEESKEPVQPINRRESNMTSKKVHSLQEMINSLCGK